MVTNVNMRRRSETVVAESSKFKGSPRMQATRNKDATIIQKESNADVVSTIRAKKWAFLSQKLLNKLDVIKKRWDYFFEGLLARWKDWLAWSEEVSLSW